MSNTRNRISPKTKRLKIAPQQPLVMFEIAVQIRAITEAWLIFTDPRAVAPNSILISNPILSTEYSAFSSTYDFLKKMHPRIGCMAAYLILSSSTGRSGAH